MYNQKVIFCLVAVLALAAQSLGRSEPIFDSPGSDGGVLVIIREHIIPSFGIGKELFQSLWGNRKSANAVSNGENNGKEDTYASGEEKDGEITNVEDSASEIVPNVADKTEEKDERVTEILGVEIANKPGYDTSVIDVATRVL